MGAEIEYCAANTKAREPYFLFPTLLSYFFCIFMVDETKECDDLKAYTSLAVQLYSTSNNLRVEMRLETSSLSQHAMLHTILLWVG